VAATLKPGLSTRSAKHRKLLLRRGLCIEDRLERIVQPHHNSISKLDHSSGTESMLRSLSRSFASVAVFAAAAAPVQAQFAFVSSRAVIGGSGLINWGSLGTAGVELSNPTTGIAVTGTSRTATISKASPLPFERRDQGTDFNGDFSSGATLLYTRGNGGPVTIMFSAPIIAAGANFQTADFGAFTGSIAALDASQNVLATFMFNGTSGSSGNGSAIFVGIASTLSNIMGIRFTGLTSAFRPNDFAINNVSVNVSANVVPEPSTYALFGTGLIGLVGLLRRKRAV
jgi:hypothetical protein